jgi:hypothetical protein
VLQRLLLIPLLAPLLAVLLVAAINPRPSSSLRLLIWSSPALPIGLWIAMAAGGGAALSAGLTALALQPSSPPLQRRLRRGPPAAAAARPAAPEEPPPPAWGGGDAGPQRAPQEPAPTVSVPFRVIRTAGTTREPVVATPAEGWDTPLADDW